MVVVELAGGVVVVVELAGGEVATGVGAIGAVELDVGEVVGVGGGEVVQARKRGAQTSTTAKTARLSQTTSEESTRAPITIRQSL